MTFWTDDRLHHAGPSWIELATAVAARVWRSLRRVPSALVEAWMQGKRRREDRDAFLNLLGKDDAILRDIGVTRADVEYAARLPLHRSAAEELRLIARINSGNY